MNESGNQKPTIKRISTPRVKKPTERLAWLERKASGQLIRDVCGMIGTTAYGLAMLVDVSSPNQIYGWQSGYRRPNPIFLSRIVRLLIDYSKGEDLVSARYATWSDDGEPTYHYDDARPKRYPETYKAPKDLLNMKTRRKSA